MRKIQTKYFQIDLVIVFRQIVSREPYMKRRPRQSRQGECTTFRIESHLNRPKIMLKFLDKKLICHATFIFIQDSSHPNL